MLFLSIYGLVKQEPSASHRVKAQPPKTLQPKTLEENCLRTFFSRSFSKYCFWTSCLTLRTHSLLSWWCLKKLKADLWGHFWTPTGQMKTQKVTIIYSFQWHLLLSARNVFQQLWFQTKLWFCSHEQQGELLSQWQKSVWQFTLNKSVIKDSSFSKIF